LLPFTALIELNIKPLINLLVHFLIGVVPKEKLKKKSAAKVVINPTFVPTIRVFSF
jgi:hypothetical protein